MSFDLPFWSSVERSASKLRPRTEEELDPMGFTTVPRAPRVWEPDIPTGGDIRSTIFESWLRQQQAATQPIIPAQPPVAAAPDMGMPQIGAEGVIRHTGLRGQVQEAAPQEPADSFLGTPEPFTRVGRVEAWERFGVPSGAPSYQKLARCPQRWNGDL